MKVVCIKTPIPNDEELTIGKIYESVGRPDIVNILKRTSKVVLDSHYFIVSNTTTTGVKVLKKEYFIPLDEYRSEQLNKILEN